MTWRSEVLCIFCSKLPILCAVVSMFVHGALWCLGEVQSDCFPPHRMITCEELHQPFTS